MDLFLELSRLRGYLETRNLESNLIDIIIAKAQSEIELELRQHVDNAMEQAVQAGVDKQSAEFINEVRPKPGDFILETESQRTDFTEPPYPMLDRLLQGAKPMKDGSGVYKIIPVGGSNNKKPPVHANIWDAQKAIMAERYEQAAAEYNKVKPRGSKANFRTATSKQNTNTQCVQPEKVKDFSNDLANINTNLQDVAASIISRVIRSYEELY